MQATPKAAVELALVSRPAISLNGLTGRIRTLGIRRPGTAELVCFAKKLVLRACPDFLLQAAKKIHYARVLRSISEDEEPDIKLVKYLVKPGACVADIGANFGVHTKFSSELVGQAGHVYSVEPIPLTFDILRSNVKRLGLGNVDVINCAVSNFDGAVTMEVPLYEEGGENFYEAKIVPGGETDRKLRNVTVDARTIDTLLADKPEVAFIKLDVEGHELNCVKGAIRTIGRARPAWLIEIAGDPDDPDANARETFAILADYGYDAFWFDGRNLVERRPGDTSINYFFLVPEHVEAMIDAGFPASRVRRRHEALEDVPAAAHPALAARLREVTAGAA